MEIYPLHDLKHILLNAIAFLGLVSSSYSGKTNNKTKLGGSLMYVILLTWYTCHHVPGINI
jgi:hypothetical protein